MADEAEVSDGPSGIFELTCVTCGYDLRGLPIDGPCPECGTAIERSIGGDRLAAANAVCVVIPMLGPVATGTGLLVSIVAHTLGCMGAVLGIILIVIVVRLCGIMFHYRRVLGFAREIARARPGH